ncbi:MAG: hypothetical protein RL375_3919 [Pseudomonadota bacterium]
MRIQVTFTHKGWFGLCPVYFADLDRDSPMVEPRHWAWAPLMWLSEGAFSLAFMFASAADPHFVPKWPLQVTGLTVPPVVREFDW